MKSLLLAAGLFLVLSACASEKRFSLEGPRPQRTVSTTAPEHSPQDRTIPSAGPLKAAMVGQYMDAQERDFRARLRATGALVARIGDDLVVSWRNDVLFSGDDLSGEGDSAVQRLAELLRHYDHSAIQVSGYTDTRGSTEESLSLSQRRAKAIADRLEAGGVSHDRVSFQGLGATHLRVATGLGQSEPRNRRVEIRVIALPQA
jgi:outer membrane protein OmpA-like peptidoglycan-associated protein